MHQKFNLILMIVIASVIHEDHAIRVDNFTTASESADSNPKAEALTLVIHKYPPKSRIIAPRNDDVVHVYHTSRPKRKPSSRQRRPSSSSQYRSKIKTKGQSNFGGFKDYGFPPFPTKSGYGEPPRASNKYKFGPPTKASFDNYGFNAQPSNKKSKKQPAQVYGPPPTVNNNFDSNFNHLTINPSKPFDTKTLQTLQQQQANFPSFSIDTVEPVGNFYANNNEFPVNNFPLETGSGFNSQKTSYGNPVNSVRGNVKNFAEPAGNFNFDSGSSNFNANGNQNFNTGNSNFNTGSSNFNPGNSNFNTGNSNFNPGSSNFNTGISSFNNFQSNSNFQRPSSSNTFEKNFAEPSNNNFQQNSGNFQSNSKNSNPSSNFQFNPTLLGMNLNSNQNNFPKLPTKYETKDFSTPTRTNPISANQFLNEFTNFNEVPDTQNSPSKNRNRLNNFNKFNNFDYDFKGQRNTPVYNDDDEEEENLDYLFTSTTTRRPKTRTTTIEPITTTKRPKKNSFGKRKRPGKISVNHNLDADDLRDAFTESSDVHEVEIEPSSDDFINQFDSQREKTRQKNFQHLHEIPSTLKTARKQNAALKTALGDDFVNSQIVSIHKSIEKDPNFVNFEEFGFNRKNDNFENFGGEFSVGSEILFGKNAEPVRLNSFPKNHRFL